MNECKIHRGCAQFSIASMIVNRAANAFCTAAQTAGKSHWDDDMILPPNNWSSPVRDLEDRVFLMSSLLLNGLNWGVLRSNHINQRIF